MRSITYTFARGCRTGARQQASTSNNGIRFVASYSPFADGGVGEVFVSNHKAGSHLNACVRDLGVVASLALQFGCSLDTLRRALLRNADGSPATALGAALD